MISFRKATAADVGLIQSLAQEAWKTAYAEILQPEQISYMLRTLYSTEVLLSQLANPGQRFFVIYSNFTAIGFMGFEINFEPNTTKLHKLYLLAEHRKLGAGKIAIDFLKQQALDAENSRIILNVNKENPAIQFYKTNGFQIYAEGIFDIGSGFVMDDFLMQCSI